MVFKKIFIAALVLMLLFAVNLFVIFDETYTTVFQSSGKVDTISIKEAYMQASKLGDTDSMDKFTDNLVELYLNQNSVVEESVSSIYIYSFLLFGVAILYLLSLVYIEWKLLKYNKVKQ